MKYHSILALAVALGIAVAGPAFAQTSSSNTPTQSTNQPTLPSLTTNPPDALENYAPGQHPWDPEAVQNLQPNGDPPRDRRLDNRDSTTTTGQSTRDRF
jgi:hypothetical protein